MPGPAPDPNALRRERKDDKSTWTTLPAEGRTGDVPPWPLGDHTKSELAQWEREWKRPQAVMWERDHQEEEVALYVRTLRRVTSAEADAPMLSAFMRMQNNLGLSQPGMMRLRWRIEAQKQEKATPHESGSGRRAAKERFKVIEGRAAS
ncbi:MAG TPA: hypothetical protein VFJ93_07590 [Gaiellaceae bacterium]|nr:hypothetical protein [Gaiellaceae bacterium]